MHRFNITRKNSKGESEHFFRVDIEDANYAPDVARALVAKFKEEEGHKVTCAEWRTSGQNVSMRVILGTN